MKTVMPQMAKRAPMNSRAGQTAGLPGSAPARLGSAGTAGAAWLSSSMTLLGAFLRTLLQPGPDKHLFGQRFHGRGQIGLDEGRPDGQPGFDGQGKKAVSYTHLRAHETVLDLVCRLLLEKK